MLKRGATPSSAMAVGSGADQGIKRAFMGVLTPILAWRDADGGVRVRAGQRRTLAAREAGVATVPVYVVDANDEDTARRIIEQLIENDHREALSDGDSIQAWRASNSKDSPPPRSRGAHRRTREVSPRPART